MGIETCTHRVNINAGDAPAVYVHADARDPVSSTPKKPQRIVLALVVKENTHRDHGTQRLSRSESGTVPI